MKDGVSFGVDVKRKPDQGWRHDFRLRASKAVSDKVLKERLVLC
jgi:hypothetical protein